MMNWLIKTWHENKSILLFIVLMTVFRSSFADWNEVPTGSMKPTILEGDRILVNKMAYDLRVPFSHISLLKIADPARGDIIVFDSKVVKKRLVKRAVGIPGDMVELKNNILYINYEPLRYKKISSSGTSVDKIEDLLGIEHIVRLKKSNSYMSNFKRLEIPEGYYLALGDNRDNSADSRVFGLVPRKEIIGRSKYVVLSLDYENHHIPRSKRSFQQL